MKMGKFKYKQETEKLLDLQKYLNENYSLNKFLIKK